jgi:hypothetical protein
MYRDELSLFRWLTSWFPRLLVAGSFALGACDAGDGWLTLVRPRRCG